jgi:peptidoglycan/LPS O-acetylase OafA/YrhL
LTATIEERPSRSAAIQARSIPSLDGLRAVAVVSVILGHSEGRALDSFPILAPFRRGEIGVALFFVISGFLITYLLLKEQDETGDIHLQKFYFRRTLRIFPPFYAYVAVVGMLTAAGSFSVSAGAFLSALTYTWNFNNHRDLWIFGHLWSLSLEEQFYLIWPTCLVYLSRRVLLQAALISLCLAPVARILMFLLVPTLQKSLHLTLFLLPDHFLMGCLMALASRGNAYEGVFRAVVRPQYATLGTLYLFIAGPILNHHYRAFRPLIGYSCEAVCIGLVLAYVVSRPASWPGKFLNLRIVRHVGVISYSLYLWQQMFTGPETARGGGFPINLVLILGCAELSYWMIERPSIRWRMKFRGNGAPAAVDRNFSCPVQFSDSSPI